MITSTTNKRLIDFVLPTVQGFAKKYNASALSVEDSEITVRIPGRRGIVTVQVLIVGKMDDKRLEVCSFGTSGINARQERISVPQDYRQIDLGSFSSFLDKVIT